MYEVNDLVDALKGHDPNRVMKIKLANGSTHEINGLQFVSKFLGGDGILYITEKNPLRGKYEKKVEAFIIFAEAIIKECNIYHHYLNTNLKKYDTFTVLRLQNELGVECDIWFDRLKLDIKYKSGAESEAELSDKLDVLKCWLQEKDIPKDIRP